MPKKNSERSLNVLQLRDPNVEADQFWDQFVDTRNELGDDEATEGIEFDPKIHEKELNNIPLHFYRFFGRVGWSL